MEADILESKKGSISCPEVWRPIFLESKKDLYLVQKYGVLMDVFCSLHRHNYLFHYHGCSACH